MKVFTCHLIKSKAGTGLQIAFLSGFCLLQFYIYSLPLLNVCAYVSVGGGGRESVYICLLLTFLHILKSS